MQKIVVLGATSGIAQAVQRLCANSGMDVFLVARSAERLAVLRTDLLARGAHSVSTFAADLSDISMHEQVVQCAQADLPGFDTVLLAYGTLQDQKECVTDVELARQELHTNFLSAALLLSRFAQHFEKNSQRGCLAAITSVAGDRGRSSNYTYGAAKGGLSLYLQGMRNRLHRQGITVITIKPGPTDTPMLANADHKVRKLAADPELVARAIFRALQRRTRRIIYTPWYWRYVMTAVKLIPERIYSRLQL